MAHAIFLRRSRCSKHTDFHKTSALYLCCRHVCETQIPYVSLLLHSALQDVQDFRKHFAIVGNCIYTCSIFGRNFTKNIVRQDYRNFSFWLKLFDFCPSKICPKFYSSNEKSKRSGELVKIDARRLWFSVNFTLCILRCILRRNYLFSFQTNLE